MASRKRKNRRKTISPEVKLRTSGRLRKKSDENSGKAIDDNNNKEKESVLVSCSTPNKKKPEKSKEKRTQKHLHQNQRKKIKLNSDSLKKTDDDEKNGSRKGNKKDFSTKTTTRRKIDRSRTKKPRQRKVLEESYDSSEDGDDESSLASSSSVHLPVFRGKGDEDEDYNQASSSSSSSSEDEESSTHACLSKRFRNNRRQRKKKNEESDKDDNYDPDFSRDSSSSEEDDKVDKELLSQLAKSNKRSRKNVDLEDSSDDNDNVTDDIDNTDVFSQDLSSEEEEEVVVEGISTPTKKTEKLTSLRNAIEQRSPLKFCQVCPSKVDEITRGSLEEVHVCWVSPDGKNKQCFNLETLKKVALSRHKMLKDKNKDKDGDKDRIEYLQPPHFLSPMEDDLKDQIALKFGHEALDIHNVDANHHTGSSFSSHRAFSANSDDYFSADAFEEHFSTYTKKQMGNTDMYCCPICYVEASRRLKLLQKGYILDEAELDTDDDADGDDDKHEDEREELLKFTNDPITTLTGIDSDFNVAATFCFRKVSQVKDHLKQVHGIDCTTLDGNILFRRYQIRQADGLLQQWLTKGKSGRAHPSQMRIYWNKGYSLDFLYLLHLVDNNGGIDQDVPESILETAREFSTSFPRRALKIWAEVSGPYLKAGYAEQDDDFIVHHEDEESYDGNSDSSGKGASQSEESEEEEDPEMKIVNELRRRRGVAASTGSDSDASHSNSDDNINESDDKNNDDDDIRDAWKKYEGKEQKKNNSRNLKDDDSLELVADDYFKARYEESESESEDDWLKRKKTFKTKKDRRDEKYRGSTLKRLSKSKKSISNYEISSSESSGLSSDDEKTGRKSIGVFIEGSTRIASQKKQKPNHTTSKKKKISRTIVLSSSEDEL